MGYLTALLGGAYLGTLLFMACPCIVLICCAFACCGSGGSKKTTPLPSVSSVPSVPKNIPATTAFGKRLRKQLKSLKSFR